MRGTVRRMSARKNSLSENEWIRRESSCVRLPVASILPPVTEARIILDLRKIRIDIAEFLANPLYERADIGAVSNIAVAGHEPFAVNDVIDLAIAYVAVGVLDEIGDDIEFRQCQPDVDLLPRGAPRIVAQDQIVEFHRVLLGAGGLLGGLGLITGEDQLDPPQQD